MEESFIKAMKRSEKGSKARKQGFAPGVIYGEKMDKPVAVKFDMVKMQKIIKKGFANSRIYVKIDDELISCVVKDIQKNNSTGEIINVDMQAVAEDEKIKLKVPVTFEGKSRLEERKLFLETFRPEIEVYGKVENLPKIISVDVGEGKVGENYTLKDIKLPIEVRALEDEDEVLAMINYAK